MKKKLLIIAGVILSIYILFVTVDCVRLRYSEVGTHPFITTSIKDYENGSEYTSLGYSVKYYIDRGEETETNGIKCVEELDYYGAEFRLFGKILIWAWVE